MKARPRTTSTKPAISLRLLVDESPIAAAPAPSATKTTVKPSRNGTLATTTRRGTPRSPSRFASTAETADRYPGTSGSTHGVITETIPARKAIGIRSATPRLSRRSGRVPRRADVPAPGRAVLARSRASRFRPGSAPPLPAPAPGEHAERGGPRDDADDRQQPGEEVEAVPRGRGEHLLAPLLHELVLDLALGSRRPIRPVMYALIRCAIADSDWSTSRRAQTGHISWLSSSGSVGCCSLARAARQHQEQARASGRTAASRLERLLDALAEVGGLHTRNVDDDLARRSMMRVSGRPSPRRAPRPCGCRGRRDT